LVGYPYASLSNDFNLIDVDFSFTLLSTYPAAKNVRQLGRDLDKIQGEAVDAANTEAAEAFVIFKTSRHCLQGTNQIQLSTSLHTMKAGLRRSRFSPDTKLTFWIGRLATTKESSGTTTQKGTRRWGSTCAEKLTTVPAIQSSQDQGQMTALM
jgi:hypothetical protein